MKSRFEPGVKEAQESLDSVCRTTSDEGTRVLEARKDLGIAYMRSGDLLRARDLLKSVVVADYHSPETWLHVTVDAAHRLGYVLQGLGEYEAARAIQEQVLSHFSDDDGDGPIDGLYNLVVTMNSLGAFEELHQVGDEIIDARLNKKPPDSRKAVQHLALIAHMWQFIGDYERSARLYRRIIPQEILKLSSPKVTIKSIAIFVLSVLPGTLLMRLDPNFDPSRRWRRELAKRQRSVKRGR